MRLDFKVTEQTLEALPTNSVPRRGSCEYLELRFSLSSDWDDMFVTVFLRCDQVRVPFILSESKRLIVHPYFTHQESFMISLEGSNGNVRIPTNTICITLDASAEEMVFDAPDVEDTAYQQMLSLAKDSKEAAKAAAENASKAADSAIVAVGVSYEEDGGTAAVDVALAGDLGGKTAEFVFRNLRGPQGPQGERGERGEQGETGSSGASAYEVAKENGFEGDEKAWLASLVGADGADGADGKSAYQLALQNGYRGDVAKWLASLAGTDGADGADGSDGYTPVRGKDYFTPEDVAQIVAQASAEAKAAAVEEALSVMRAPTLIEVINTTDKKQDWYQSSKVAKAQITEICVMDSYTPSESDIVDDAWNADADNEGKITCYVIGTVDGKRLIIAGNGSGRIMANPNSYRMMFGFANVSQITGLSVIDTRNVEVLTTGFANLPKLRLIEGHENWDVRKVTAARQLFAADASLEKLDLSGWDMRAAFVAAAQEENVNIFDLAATGKMLHNCHALSEVKLHKSFDLRYMYLPEPRDYDGETVVATYRWLDVDTFRTYEDKDDDQIVTAANTVLFAHGDRADGTVGGDGLINPALVGRNVTLVADLYEKEVENV